MNLDDVNIMIADELCEQLDIEGVVINPANLKSGLLIMSSKDDSFTLHVFELKMSNESDYQIVKEICTQAYPAFSDMVNYLDSLSNFNEDDFSEFLKN